MSVTKKLTIRQPRKHPETGTAGLSVGACTPGALYKVSGYHTGFFFGRFLEVTGRFTGMFEITSHDDAARIGERVEVPHTLACIQKAAG